VVSLKEPSLKEPLAKSKKVVAMKLVSLFLLFLLYCAGPSTALENQKKTKQTTNIFIELNRLQQTETTCQVSFVLTNNLKTAIEELAFELVIFDQKQRVFSLLLIKSGEHPKAKTRVKRYNLKAVNCSSISQFLINDIKQCSGRGLTPKLCLSKLELHSRTKAKLGL